jgi:AraC-like DNA-binding protein
MLILAKPMRSGKPVAVPDLPLPATAWAFRLLGASDAGTLSCGFLTKGCGADSRKARRPSFSAVLCLAGKALYDGRWLIEPGDLFFRFTGLPHDIDITAAPWHECWISLGEPIERLLLATGQLNQEVPVRRVGLDATWLQELAAGIAPLEQAADRELPHHLVRLHGLLTTLLQPAPASGFALERAYQLLADPILMLTDVAERMALPYDAFRREFRRRTGMAPGTWRQRRLLERARRDLLVTSRPVQDIAHELGYANPFAFSAAFRRATGVSPRAWRAGAGRG